MTADEIVLILVAFLQWFAMPLLVIAVQNYVKKKIGRSLISLDVAIAISIAAIIIMVPLSALGMLPLDQFLDYYKYAAVAGGILSIPFTRFVRRRTKINGHFS